MSTTNLHGFTTSKSEKSVDWFSINSGVVRACKVVDVSTYDISLKLKFSSVTFKYETLSRSCNEQSCLGLFNLL
jgi:hypothetical protein